MIIINRLKRFTAVILAVFIFAALLGSLFIIAHEAEHDCDGENCHICAVIAVCRDTVKKVCGAFTPSVAFLLYLSLIAFAFALYSIDLSLQSPISLKVKLLN